MAGFEVRWFLGWVTVSWWVKMLSHSTAHNPPSPSSHRARFENKLHQQNFTNPWWKHAIKINQLIMRDYIWHACIQEIPHLYFCLTSLFNYRSRYHRSRRQNITMMQNEFWLNKKRLLDININTQQFQCVRACTDMRLALYLHLIKEHRRAFWLLIV